MKLFIDANILVAVLNKEYPVFSYAARVLSLANHPRFNLYTSPLCIAIAFYFAEKKCGTKAAKNKIAVLFEHLYVAEMTNDHIQQALANKKINDLEDGLEYYAALGASCNCIVTEDKKDFYFSELEVISSESFLRKYL